MLFVAEYEFGWDMLDAAVAKRLEWDAVAPEDFAFVNEYIWVAGEPPFRGVAIFECASVEAVHQFVLHYGPTLKVRVHPATDVLSAIQAYTGQAPAGAERNGRRRKERGRQSRGGLETPARPARGKRSG
jgi:hypothetical protein